MPERDRSRRPIPSNVVIPLDEYGELAETEYLELRTNGLDVYVDDDGDVCFSLDLFGSFAMPKAKKGKEPFDVVLGRRVTRRPTRGQPSQRRARRKAGK